MATACKSPFNLNLGEMPCLKKKQGRSSSSALHTIRRVALSGMFVRLACGASSLPTVARMQLPCGDQDIAIPIVSLVSDGIHERLIMILQQAEFAVINELLLRFTSSCSGASSHKLNAFQFNADGFLLDLRCTLQKC